MTKVGNTDDERHDGLFKHDPLTLQAVYDPHGDLRASLLEIAELLFGREEQFVKVYWEQYIKAPVVRAAFDDAAIDEAMKGGVAYIQEKLKDPFGPTFYEMLCGGGQLILQLGISPHWTFSAFDASHRACAAALQELLATDMPRLTRLTAALATVASYEATAMMQEVHRLVRKDASERMQRQGDLFRQTVSSGVAKLADHSRSVSAQARSTANVTSRMLARSNEVATAATQSSHAMQEAAERADSFNQAIDDIQNRVAETTSMVASASEEVDLAESIGKELADSTREIHSIIALIKAIADQTNLLALNATIEAARAGDAGRGFAVVAAEVKSLAAQTTNATKTVTEKVATISKSVTTNSAVCQAMHESILGINQSADAINGATSEQAGNVASIVASITETSTASDGVSVLIHDITGETQSIATDSEGLASRMDEFDRQIESLEADTNAFLQSISA